MWTCAALLINGRKKVFLGKYILENLEYILGKNIHKSIFLCHREKNKVKEVFLKNRLTEMDYKNRNWIKRYLS